MIVCHTHARDKLAEIIHADVARLGAGLRPRKIVIKPNWVLHQTDPDFPIRALVTDSAIIEQTVKACLEIFPGVESIVVGDCPLQFADWELMKQQSGLQKV